jgi:hypothetical protein
MICRPTTRPRTRPNKHLLLEERGCCCVPRHRPAHVQACPFDSCPSLRGRASAAASDARPRGLRAPRTRRPRERTTRPRRTSDGCRWGSPAAARAAGPSPKLRRGPFRAAPRRWRFLPNEDPTLCRGQIMCSRSEKSRRRATRVSLPTGRARSSITGNPSYRASVVVSCSCGSRNLRVLSRRFPSGGECFCRSGLFPVGRSAQRRGARTVRVPSPAPRR